MEQLYSKHKNNEHANMIKIHNKNIHTQKSGMQTLKYEQNGGT